MRRHSSKDDRRGTGSNDRVQVRGKMGERSEKVKNKGDDIYWLLRIIERILFIKYNYLVLFYTMIHC